MNSFAFKQIVFFSTMMIFLFGFSQNFEDEQYKYWYYRDRLKYFVSIGENSGQSILFSSRNPYPSGNWQGPCSTIDVTQPHMMMGFYIGMLATEYKLLKANGQNASAIKTLAELNFALDALIRMDKCEDDIPWYYSYESSDGFFIREDVPSTLNGEMLENLNSNLLQPVDYWQYLFDVQNGYGFVGNPIPISYDAARVQKRFESEDNYFMQNIESHDSQWSNYSHGNSTYWEYWKRQKFISQDELIGMLMGLSLVVKLVDDENTCEKAILITGNSVSFAKEHPECFIDENFSQNCNDWQMLFPDGSKISDTSGGNTYGLGWGIIKAARSILGDEVSRFPIIEESVRKLPKDIYDCSVFLATTGDMLGRNNECMIARLQAISNHKPVFSSSIVPGLEYWVLYPLLPFYFYQMIHSALNNNGEILDKISDNHGWEPFYPSLWAVLHEKDLRQAKYNFDFRILLDHLRTAPCSGPYNYFNNSSNEIVIPQGGWASYLRYQTDVDGQNGLGTDHFGAFSGIDYMLLYNLACLAFPDGFQYNNQTYRFPYYINLDDRHDVFTHYPYTYVYSAQGAHMNNFGSVTHPEEIRAISTIESHIIVSTATEIIYSKPQYENENLNFDEPGDVTLKAGESIKLTDGFRVDAGAHFLARIESYSCGGLSYKNMAAPPWSENYRGSYYDTLISVPMEKRAPIVYSEDNYEEEDSDMPLWDDYYYMYDTTTATELAVGVWINPNPCGNSATLTIVSENEQLLTIELYDMTGVKRETIFNDIADINLVLDLDLSSYASGTYMLRITGAGGMKVLRFVKE